MCREEAGGDGGMRRAERELSLSTAPRMASASAARARSGTRASAEHRTTMK